MKPIILYTNIFTIKDIDVKNNKYIDMYILWLHNIIKYAQLQHNDTVVTYIDQITFDFIKTYQSFNMLPNLINNFKIYVYPQPNNIKEGMLHRYNVQPILDSTMNLSDQNPYYMYLDVDVFIIKNLRNILEKLPDVPQSIFVRPEGPLLNTNYLGHILTDEQKEQLKIQNMEQFPGFSSGIFAWTNCKNINEFLFTIIQKAMIDNNTYYTIDQPFFNSAIIDNILNTRSFRFCQFDNKYIAHNVIGLHKNTDIVLINLCGEPGDNKLHWDKIMMQTIKQSLEN